MTARETFEDAARAARRLPVIEAELAALDEAWRHGEWLGSGSSYGGHSDPTAGRAGWRMHRAAALERERDELRATVEGARELVRGLELLLGSGYSGVLEYRYLESRPWQDVAEALGVCERTAYSRAAVALDTVDALGPRVLEGRGVAAG